MTDIVSIGLAVDSSQVDQATKSLDRLDRQAHETEKSTTSLTSATASLADSFRGLVTAGAVVATIGAVASAHREFSKSVSELSAITGATGADLQFYRQAAMDLGASTTFAASEVVSAFKLVASAKPELLENKEALASVTHEVLTLAEAASMDLPSAANALGGALNQFGAGADQASRFINVMAAGAKYGASEITDTSEAMKNAGSVASSLGLSFEETNAAIQALAANAVKGAEAGTGLRNVLLKLSTQSNDQFNPEIVGLSTALANLSNANLTTTQTAKLFGAENITAATNLIKQADSVKTLTGQLTGTATAYEQASINSNNLDGDIKRMTNAWSNAALVLGQTFDPILRGVTQLLTGVGNVAASVAIAFEDMGDGLGAYAAKAQAVLSLDFDQLEAINAMRDETRRVNDERIQKIWEEKKATDALAGSTAALGATKADKPVNSTASAIGGDTGGGKDKAKTTAQIEEENYNASREWLARKAIATNELETENYLNSMRWMAQKQIDTAAIEEQNYASSRRWLEERNASTRELEEQNYQDGLMYLAAKEQAQMDYHERLYNMQTGSAKAGVDFANAMRQYDYKSALQFGALMLSNLAGRSKAMFNVQKAFALANAAVALPDAVLQSFRNGGGYPWGLVPAGLMLAQGLAQIQAIKSSTFGGGTSSPSVGGGGTAAGAPVASGLPPGSTAVPNGSEQKPVPVTVREIRVTVDSDGPHSDGMRKFAMNLAETLKDMGSDARLVVS